MSFMTPPQRRRVLHPSLRCAFRVACLLSALVSASGLPRPGDAQQSDEAPGVVERGGWMGIPFWDEDGTHIQVKIDGSNTRRHVFPGVEHKSDARTSQDPGLRRALSSGLRLRYSGGLGSSAARLDLVPGARGVTAKRGRVPVALRGPRRALLGEAGSASGTNAGNASADSSAPHGHADESGTAAGAGVGLARHSSKMHRRKPWLEHVSGSKTRSSAAGLMFDIKSKGSLESAVLTSPLGRANLSWVPLDPDFDDNFMPQPDTFPISCPATAECPDFNSCGTQRVRVPPNLLPAEVRARVGGKLVDPSVTREVDFSAVQACSIRALSVPDPAKLPAPLNCPRLLCSESRCEGLVFDPACSHDLDDVAVKKWYSHMYLLHNVYLNSHGQAFNHSRFFDRSGCASYDDFSYPSGYPVVKYDVLLSLAHWATSSFYHGIVELVPMFFVFSHTPEFFQRYPIAVEVLTMNFLHSIGSFLLGPDLTRLNFRVITGDYLFYANTVVQPLYQFCGSPAPALWRELRRLHLVPKDGLPMFNPDWSPRNVHAPSHVGQLSVDDWVIILVQRFGSRSLTEHDAVLGLLQRAFGKDRVVVFKGNVDISDAKELFNRAVLLVAVHGAAMTNMIFMPFYSTVVELRPRNYSNGCYHNLADVCDLNYYLLLCEGAFETSTSCNLEKVETIINTSMPLVKALTLKP